MPKPLYRYLRLLIWYWEARLSLQVARFLTEFLTVLWIGGSLLIALLLGTAAFITWLQSVIGWPGAFLAATALWLGLGIGSFPLIRFWLKRRFRTGQFMYRMIMARAGLRLIEETSFTHDTSRRLIDTPVVLALMPILKRWLWHWLRNQFFTLLRRTFRL
jgi:hypothetical protein